MRLFNAIQFILAFCLVSLTALTAVAGDNICLESNYPELIYDPGNPKNVAWGASVTIRIIGGVPPYYWSVDNSLFFLEKNRTDVDSVSGNDGRSNTLTALPNACGKVTVTITDSRPDPITGGLKPQSVHGRVNEDYKPLKYVYATPPENQVSAPSTPATVTISGGIPPYTFHLTNENFSFGGIPAVTNLTTNATSVTVSNINYGCGVDVEVHDQCPEGVIGFVRGINGAWIHIAKNEKVDRKMSGPPDEYTFSCPGVGRSGVKMEGKYFLRECIDVKSKMISPPECPNPDTEVPPVPTWARVPFHIIPENCDYPDAGASGNDDPVNFRFPCCLVNSYDPKIVIYWYMYSRDLWEWKCN